MNSLLVPTYSKGKFIGSVGPDIQIGIRIAESGHMNLVYAEMLAEFDDIDVNT